MLITAQSARRGDRTPPSPLGEGLGMRGSGSRGTGSVCGVSCDPSPPALARAIAVRLLILASPKGEGGAREARSFLRWHEIPAFAGTADAGWC